jgi:DNA-binding CsgD family transcriptional regulator
VSALPGATRGLSGLAPDRVRLLEAAFELAPMPGFVFSYSGMEHANRAGHDLLRSRRLDSPGLVRLHGIVYGHAGQAKNHLQAAGARWTVLNAPAGHGAPSLSNYRVCFLLEEAPQTPACAGTIDSAALSPAQRRIASLLTEGLTNREVAQRLGIAAETVRKQVGRILQKTETHTRTELVARMLRG